MSSLNKLLYSEDSSIPILEKKIEFIKNGILKIDENFIL